VTIDQDNSVYYNIDRDQDRSSASDLAYGFSIDKPPSHGGLVRPRIRRFEVSRFQGLNSKVSPVVRVSTCRFLARQRGGGEKVHDELTCHPAVPRYPDFQVDFFNFSKSVSRFKLPTPTPLIKAPRLKTQHPNSRTHDSHIITPYQTFFPPPSAYCVLYGYYLGWGIFVRILQRF
jgi:hypothetical protein